MEYLFDRDFFGFMNLILGFVSIVGFFGVVLFIKTRSKVFKNIMLMSLFVGALIMLFFL